MCVREIFSAGKYKLAIRQQMVQIADMTWGTYDAALGASSIKTYGSINNNSQIYQLMVKSRNVSRTTFLLNCQRIQPIFKSYRQMFYLIFEDKNRFAFIKAHNSNFNHADNLKAILKFCVE